MTFRPSAPHKKHRWLAVLAVVALATGLTVVPALAVPSFSFVSDQDGRNDEPGQKDLTAQSAAFDGTTFYTAWKWDDISWSGKNTGDACSLFDSDANGLVDFAVCVTIGKPAVETSTRVYSCGDTREDRCTNPIALIGTEVDDSSADWCSVSNAAAQSDFLPDAAGDTQATCNISQAAADIGSAATGIVGANLLNTCSYPSQEPNSDPSDCVIIIANVDVSLSTTSGGSLSWDATLTDTATLTPAGTGSVTFKLYSGTPCSDDATTGNLVATSTDTSAPFEATPVAVSGSGNATYFWTVTYNPDSGFNGDEEVCSEQVTINASIGGSTSP